jgi:vanillate/3-O-methylgallate O-demethylase
MPESLEERLKRFGNAARMLREAPAGPFKSPYPMIHSNWQDEQAAWVNTAVLFDQSHHMTDVYFRGPDVTRLLADTGTNSFATYGRGKAKHFVACNPDGYMIGTAVLFGLEDDEASLVGPAGAANWVQYQAETGGYDVEVVRDERTRDTGGKRLTYRYEIEGPATAAIIERANGGPTEHVPFFHMTELSMAGHRVRALSHTMAGVPGSKDMGLELWGPVDEGPAVLDALLAAGEEFGLVRGGALAYYTGSVESGYAAQPAPAIYSGDNLRPYREWLAGDGYEGKLSVGGSFRSDDIEDFYVTPFDFGYGHLVKFDHDFIGRGALEQMTAEPHRSKVWLRWNRDDVARVYASSLYGGESRAKYLDTPLGRYARVHWDAVLDKEGKRQVGVSTLCAYTVNVQDWMSVAFVDEADAVEGAEVTLVWGEENGGTPKLAVERHVQTSIRATLSRRPPVTR